MNKVKELEEVITSVGADLAEVNTTVRTEHSKDIASVRTDFAKNITSLRTDIVSLKSVGNMQSYKFLNIAYSYMLI